MADKIEETGSLFEGLEAEGGGWDLEQWAWARGYGRVAGVDEAGRGPLAGPVAAAAVVLDPGRTYPGVDDSKKLSPEQRERAFGLICREALAVGLGLAWPEEIDRDNILAAALKAMARAVLTLSPAPDFLLVDGNFPAPLPLPQKPVVRGDGLSVSIAAASIVAKVVRDRLMEAYHRSFPQYGFARHKGYATRGHLEALKDHGPCRIHRHSFQGVTLGRRTGRDEPGWLF
ncbi:MAG: ribonuclease HII [Thermodesulfobacteriota bacterium]